MRLDSWGTLAEIGLEEKCFPSTLTWKDLLDRQDLMKFSSGGGEYIHLYKIEY